MKLYREYLSDKIVLLAIKGTPAQIELQFNSWYNFGATDAEAPMFESPNFAYIWTNLAKFKKWCYESSWNFLANLPKYSKNQTGLEEEAKEMAIKREESYDWARLYFPQEGGMASYRVTLEEIEE